MNSAELKSRTKQYAIDIIRFVDSVPPKRTFEFEEDNESAQHHLLVQITDQHAEHDQELISFSKPLSLKKKLTNVNIGENSYLNEEMIKPKILNRC